MKEKYFSMNIEIFIFFLFLFDPTFGQLKTCVPRQYEGKSSFVCVCNSTYCDEFPALESLKNGQAAVYTSSASGKRFERTVSSFRNYQDPNSIQLTIDTTKTFQKIIGFGGAMTDSSCINFYNLSSASQQNLLNAYYGTAGIGYTVGRIPIAASDFTDREYNFDDVSGDFNLTNFALAYEDLDFKIPFIKLAKSLVGSKLKLFGSPWGPPGWLKTNGNMSGKGTLIGKPGSIYYQTWANYFLRFFEEYAKQGVTFWGLTVQNEPNVAGDYPCLNFDASSYGGFVKLNLGPTLKNNTLTQNLKIMIYDTSRQMMPNFTNEILSDPETAKYVDGIALHWYHDSQNINSGTDPIILTEAHNAHPDKFMFGSEACTGLYPWEGRGPSLGDWSRADRYTHDIIEDLNHWVTGWTDWNMILNTEGGPSFVGNIMDSPIIVNATADEFYKNPMYYALGHFSKFLVENSTRVQLEAQGTYNTSLLEAVALLTQANQRVLVINNRDTTSNYSVTIKDAGITGLQLTLSIEPSSFTTIVWNACSCPSGNWFASSVNPCNCYRIIQSLKDWTSANNDCQQQNPTATLASIDSAFENSNLLAIGQNQTSCSQFFIGLTQQSINNWTWVNNDTSSYRNWRAGYPTSNGNEKYSQLNINDGKWTNIDGTNPGCYICEIKTS